MAVTWRLAPRAVLSRTARPGLGAPSARSLVPLAPVPRSGRRPIPGSRGGWGANPMTRISIPLSPLLAMATDEEEEEYELEIDDPSTEFIHLTDGFFPEAEALRSVYDENFDDPRRTHGERFVWDYWHVPGQYSLIRTPADQYFPADLWAKLEDALLTYGQEKLGCRAITPVWLSYYVDGHGQEMHADVPHGPWAFVLSLTRWEGRGFEGGETEILRPHVLDYWRAFDAGAVVERDQLMEAVEPLFNRLTVFDPRFPHGVRAVRGTRDPRGARIVLHGWFTEPSPFFDGALGEEDCEGVLNKTLPALYAELARMPRAMGTLAARLRVSGASGRVEGLEWLTDTLIVHPDAGDAAEGKQMILNEVVGYLIGMGFPPAEGGGDTLITIPFQFE